MIEYTLTKEDGSHQYLISVSTIGDETLSIPGALRRIMLYYFFLFIIVYGRIS
jgi:hypothetical protein